MADPKEHLHMDRRLLLRRGWITDKERSDHIEGLPDVSEKGEFVDLPGSSAPADPGASDAAGPGGAEPQAD